MNRRSFLSAPLAVLALDPYTGPFKAMGYTDAGAWAEEIIPTKDAPRKIVTQAIGYARWDGKQWVSGD